MEVEGRGEPIGSSLAQFLEDHDDQHQNALHYRNPNTSHNHDMPTPMDTSEHVADTTPNTSRQVSIANHVHHPSVQHPSLLLDACQQPQSDASVERSRILLCGPPRSGKTSLAMNLAYSMASAAAPCLCFNSRMCRCTAVVIYKALPSVRGNLVAAGGGDEFPLLCRPVGEKTQSSTESTAGDQNLEPNRNGGVANQGNVADSELLQTPTKDDAGTATLDWDPQILKRIRMHRVSSVREICHDLLSMLGKQPQEQPHGAIIIDDIDKIVMRDVATRTSTTAPWGGNHQGNAQRTAINSAFLQITAVAADTAMALEESQDNSTKRGVAVLVTTEDTHAIVSPCMDTIVTLRPQPMHHHLSAQQQLQQGRNDNNHHWWNTSDDSDKCSVDSTWNAEVCPSPWNGVSNESSNTTYLEYAVMNTPVEGDKEIRWKRPEGMSV